MEHMGAQFTFFFSCSNNRFNFQKAEQLKIEKVCSWIPDFIHYLQHLLLGTFITLLSKAYKNADL